MSDGPAARRQVTLFVLFSVELLAISILRLPDSLSFDRFAFCDNGTNLTLQYLLAHSYSPTLDFGYHYGLMPLLIGRIWFAIFGLTPFAYQALMAACNIAIAYAFARIATALRFGAFGLALMFVALGFAVQATYPSLAQALEAVLLGLALSEQSAGRRRSAMGLAASAIFAKPSMGYVYCLVTALFAAVESRRAKAGWIGFIRSLVPAAVVFGLLAITFSAVFGPAAVVRTVLPIGGASAYRAMNFGFFTGAGQGLWRPDGTPWLFYLMDVRGFWLAGTLYLLASGFAAATRLVAESEIGTTVESRRDEIILTCAVVHLVFVLAFFGNQFSWIYYSYFLVAGIAAAADGNSMRRRVAVGLCALALLSWIDVAFWLHRWWLTTRPDAVADGLWISDQELSEWSKVLVFTRDNSVAMLDSDGAVQLMFPGFEPPVSAYLETGWMLPQEIERKASQLSRASIVAVPIGVTICKPMPDAPEFDLPMKGYVPLWSGKYFAVYRPPGASPSPTTIPNR